MAVNCKNPLRCLRNREFPYGFHKKSREKRPPSHVTEAARPIEKVFPKTAGYGATQPRMRW